MKNHCINEQGRLANCNQVTVTFAGLGQKVQATSLELKTLWEGCYQNEEGGTGKGERGTENGKRGTGNEERATGNGQRGTGNGERGNGAMGQWGNGERGMEIGEKNIT